MRDDGKDFAQATRSSYQRAVEAAELRAYYLIGQGVTTTFYVPTGSEFPDIQWDFFRENGVTTFSDKGFLAWLEWDGNPVYETVKLLEAHDEQCP